MIFIYTYKIYVQSHIYITIPYMIYMAYEDNCNKIVYGIYS